LTKNESFIKLTAEIDCGEFVENQFLLGQSHQFVGKGSGGRLKEATSETSSTRYRVKMVLGLFVNLTFGQREGS
jgi:hypothetical protein